MTLTLTGSGPTSASSWSPLSLTGLELWLDFSAVAAGAIASQSDLSGNSRTASQGTGTAQPTGVAAVLNGKNIARFDGGDSLVTATWAQPGLWTRFAVAKATAAAGTQQLCCSDDNGVNRHAQLRYNIANLEAVTFNAAGTGFTDPEGASPTSFQVLEQVRDTGLVEAFVNGTGAASTVVTGTNNTATVAASIGARGDAGQPLTGDIAEVVWYSVALSSSDRSLVRSYLGTKYGITVS
jgi:hypothetical protein